MKRLALVLLVAAGCAPGTAIVSRWKSPQAGRLTTESRVMAMVVARSPDVRRRGEDELARLIPGVTPSYPVLSAGQLRDRALVRAYLQDQGYELFAVVRFVGVGTARWSGVRSVDGSVPLWDVYSHLWAQHDDPVHPYVETEMRLFRVRDGALVWMAVSDTREPARMEALIDEVVRACRDQLAADGLLGER